MKMESWNDDLHDSELKVMPELHAHFELAFSHYQHKVRTHEQDNSLPAWHKLRDVVGEYLVMERHVNDRALVAHRSSEHYKPFSFGVKRSGLLPPKAGFTTTRARRLPDR